jgi:hypothetical protein
MAKRRGGKKNRKAAAVKPEPMTDTVTVDNPGRDPIESLIRRAYREELPHG